MSFLNKDLVICGYPKAKATKKGVVYSDYKLTYKGLDMYVARQYDDTLTARGWNLQEEDGGQPYDTVNTLEDAKAALVNDYEFNNRR
jgi:hypothetical protein